MLGKQRTPVLFVLTVSVVLVLLYAAFFSTRLVSVFAASEEQPKAHLDDAVNLMQKGRMDEAKTELEILLKKYPKEPAIYNNLAIISIQKGDIDGAEELLRQALKTNPDYEQIHNNIKELLRYKAQLAYNHLLDQSGEPSLPKLGVLKSFVLPKASGYDALVVVNADSKHAVQPQKAKKPSKSNQKAALIEVRRQTRKWLRTWSGGVSKTYRAYYAKNYSPEGATHKKWVENRDRLVKKERNIKVVVVGAMRIQSLSEGRIQVSFAQKYTSKTFSSDVKKVLIWVRQDGAWKIGSEISIPDRSPKVLKKRKTSHSRRKSHNQKSTHSVKKVATKTTTKVASVSGTASIPK